MALPLLALPTAPVGDASNGLTISERKMLRRSVLLGELQRLQSENEAPPGAPENGKWRIVKVVVYRHDIAEKVVWHVQNSNGSEEGYDESGVAVRIATKEDIAKAERRSKAGCAVLCLFIIALTIGAIVAVVVFATSNSNRISKRIDERSSKY